ncbi:MAG TPA: aminopeptidase N [Rhodanobacteraceae bacterium]|nr:aminopeptidase N [Rhodanobacteraceae bacterium]
MNASTGSRTDTVVRLADYRPPAWRVEHVELTFDLGIDETLVGARLHLRCERDEPLWLDGEELELLELVLDGRALAAADYTLDACGLTLPGARDGSVLETKVRIAPARNTELSGLYLSGSRQSGFLLTQCEAQGFRRITFFPDRPDVLAKYSVTLRADRARFPVLLAGGDPQGAGELPDGRHWARFADPYPKPSYLFALVAGHLEKIERAYRTADGRDVTLRIFAEADAIGGCGYAMDALERAMRWDERVYGRNYDLAIFNVVATHDFNMGAMENKGLNIFNAKYLLADPDTTTDDEYRHIEAVIAHEYFHNWSGNRVTCRDWFQLSLKEGFTVFREQQFCADMQSAALQRIDEVSTLRRVQFPEDAGPLAHPVRPAEYTAIDNFYTPTVYEKGAELVRMIAGRLGPERFRRGTDLYFSRNDGRAATIEDFLGALGDANGLDLSPYLAWYAQAGTPQVGASGDYDPVARTYTLTLAQTTAPTPGQAKKSALPIPVRVALFAPDGRRIPMRSHDDPGRVHEECVLELTQREQRFVFVQVDARPVPSLLRGFSAPVQWRYAYAPRELALLLRHESEGYDRWNAGQQLAAAAYDALHAGAQDRSSLDAWCGALAELFEADAAQLDPALLADLLTPPSSVELDARHEPLDPERAHLAREALENVLASRLGGRLHARYRALHENETGALDASAQARRRLKGRVLALLLRADPREGAALAVAQYEQARSMTDRLSAMAALVRMGAPQAGEVLRAFRTRHDGKPLVLDKWFALQAQAPERETLARVQALGTDPAFSLHNPNRVQALLGAFARGNPVGFHRPDGEGYRYIAQKVIEIDALNPQNSARLAKSFESWHKLEPRRRAAAGEALEMLHRQPALSRDLADLVSRLRAAR